MRSSSLAAVVALFAVLPGSVLVRAQQLTGSVQGTVKDPSGGLVGGALVDLMNSTIGIRQSERTDTGGAFFFPAVKPGAYNLAASLNGFKTASQRLEVELNKNSKVDFVLMVGEVTERVEVTAPPVNVDITHTEVAVNVESRLVVDLPSVNRDITALVEMVPGARQVQGVTAGGSQV